MSTPRSDGNEISRTVGSTLVSVVVGVVLGVVAVVGLTIFTSEDAGSSDHAISSDDALLGHVEYGSR